VLCVDDVQANVDGAKSCGIDAVIFKDNSTLLRDLESRNLVSKTILEPLPQA
jgi:hypothetical protein